MPKCVDQGGSRKNLQGSPSLRKANTFEREEETQNTKGFMEAGPT